MGSTVVEDYASVGPNRWIETKRRSVGAKRFVSTTTIKSKDCLRTIFAFRPRSKDRKQNRKNFDCNFEGLKRLWMA